MKSVNEEGTLYFTVKFYDTDDALFTPSSAAYRIDCLTSGNEVRAWTDLIPADVITIAVTGSDNQIYDEARSREIRQMVIKYADGSGNEQKSQIQYRVDNLKGIR
jgi:hypothetical protein